MHRATAVVGGCYGASRDDGGSDQGSVVVRAAGAGGSGGSGDSGFRYGRENMK